MKGHILSKRHDPMKEHDLPTIVTGQYYIVSKSHYSHSYSIIYILPFYGFHLLSFLNWIFNK